MKALWLTCCTAALLAWVAAPQDPPAAHPAVALTGPAVVLPGKPDYSGEPVVIQHFDSVYRMAADGTGSRTITLAARIQSESALKSSGVVGIGFAGNSQQVELAYVRVRRPDGTLVATDVADAIQMPTPVTQAAPFYSDLKQLQVPVRSLRVGDTLEWQARVVQTKAEAPGHFWGQEPFVDDTVALAETLELRVPKDKYVNVWSKKAKPVETVEGDERVFRWTAPQLKPTTGKEAEAAAAAEKKRVLTAAEELDAVQGKLPDVAWTTFRSWAEVGDWYRGLEQSRLEPNAAVKAKAAELTAGKSTQTEKAQAIYAYVGAQIRYIGVAFGVGRYQPHAAAIVLENQYGDCKDKHTLLASMLGAAGVRADAVLIGAGIRFNPDLPSPAAFNHAITAAQVDGRRVYLDSTAEVAPYGMLQSILRDRRALLVPTSGPAEVVTTPATLPFPVSQTMESVGSLEANGTSHSRLVLTERGDEELILRQAFRQVSSAQIDQLMQALSQAMGYAGTANHGEVSKLDDTATPLKISYDYLREKNGDWDNRRILAQLAPVRLPTYEESEPPIQTILLGEKRVETSTSSMKLPEGWGAELPEATHAHSPYGTVDLTYRFDKGTIYAQRRLEVLREKVPVAEWKAYAQWVKAANLGEQFIQLTNTGGSAVVLGNSLGTDPERLIRIAALDLQAHQTATAVLILDQIKASHPEQAGLWSLYGAVAAERRDFPLAVADFHKELTLHPESFRTYAALSTAELAQGHRREAEEALRQWASAAPEDPSPPTQLSAMLIVDGNGPEAVKAAQDSLKRAEASGDEPANAAPLKLQLARAEKLAAMKEESRVILVALLQSTEQPGMLNDCAYELADQGLELPLAEKSARAALRTLEEESRSWTLDEDPSRLSRQTQLLTAAWDTMGWILFRQGNAADAESYVKAAWLNREDPVVTGHLKAIEAALKRPMPQGGAAARTFPLGAAQGLKGTAEYHMLLAPDGAVRVVGFGDTRIPPGEARLTGMKFPGYWPRDSDARLVRIGMLNCHQAVCELILEP